MPSFLRVVKGVGAVAGVIAYAVLMHRENASGHPGMWGAFLAIFPLLMAVLVMIANRRWRATGLVLLLAGVWLFTQAWPILARHSGILFWLQDMTLLLVLLTLFGRTLLAGHKPLCVMFAEMMHGPLSPRHARYAHHVTVAWAVFFAVLATVSTALFFFSSLTVWSLYANFMVLPLIGMMFVVEYQVRKRVLADAPHGRFVDAIYAYIKTSRSQG